MRNNKKSIEELRREQVKEIKRREMKKLIGGKRPRPSKGISGIVPQ